jgi:two-component sensor histidine kinase
MNGTGKSSGWRSFALKAAVLALVWLLLAITFAVQFYWIGKDLPFNISWKESLLRALVEACPWMILSPAVVWLAERCRFDRARRLWGVFPHLPACLVVALAYQGIFMFLTQRSGGVLFFNFQTGMRSVGFAAGGADPVRAFAEDTNAPPRAHPPIRLLHVRDDNFSVHVMDLPPGEPAAGVIQVEPARAPSAGGFPLPSPPPMPGPWTRFFHLAGARAQSTIPIYWAIVFVTWVFGYYQQLSERERRTLELESRLMQANLQTLKAQLQPHFLFNALNAIASLVRRKPDAAEDMIGSLSDFLRMTLDSAQQHEVPLRREIEFLDLYLEIQQTRFGERLRILKEIAPTALDVAVPALILQPLVENSIRHGIEPRETGGTILIRALRHENSLRLEVRDDGEGLKGGQLIAFREGVGLSNTKSRLQELYGEAHRFQITPNAEGGLTVAVELPWRVVASEHG